VAPAIIVVSARETAPPDETPPVECWLITTLAVTTAEDAACIITWYSPGWRIERFHFTEKPGGRQADDLPLETLERQEPASALYSLVAWPILYITYPVRVDANPSPTVAFSQTEISVLERAATSQKPTRPAVKSLMLQDAVRAIAERRSTDC